MEQRPLDREAVEGAAGGGAGLERATRVAAIIGGYLILLTALVVAVDVIARRLFAVSMGGADEIAGYAFLIGSVLAMGYTAVQRGHIRIDFAYIFLPRPLQAILDLVALVSLLLFTSLLAWYGTHTLLESIEIGSTANTPLRTPLWIPQTLWVGSLWLFFAVLVLLIATAGRALVRRDFDEVRRLAGAASVHEEVEAELETVVARRERQGEAAR
jgi:TRAP-type C4-dicarboxylate transport system permease small subunit